MKKLIILLSIFLLFLSCETLTTEEQLAIDRAKLETKLRSKFSVDVIKHPDYFFERTNPNALIVYDGFEPKKNYLIIGKISIKQLANAKDYFTRKWIKEDVENKVTEIGGNAILITEKKIGKKVYRETVGVFMPLSLYLQTTTEKEEILDITYFGHVIRWIDE